jgi:hypothetical protein
LDALNSSGDWMNWEDGFYEEHADFFTKEVIRS